MLDERFRAFHKLKELRIYLFIYNLALRALRTVICPFSGLPTLEFAVANAGLITHSCICTYLGVILIRYSPYIPPLRVRYVHYMLACKEFVVVMNLLAILNHIWSGACEQRFTINIPLLLCYAVHVFYSQPIRLN